MELRQATPDDIPHIAAIKSAVWPDEHNKLQHMAAVIAETDHVTVIAFEDGEAAGFADGFLTLSASGVLRWELDLLAVHPDFRGRGLAPQLIQVNLEAARWTEPKQSRALIQVENSASERSFARCGYVPDDFVSGLYVAIDGKISGHPVVEKGHHLIPVNTLSYSGVWVEGAFSQAGFDAGQLVRIKHGWQVAGAVLPVHDHEAITAAEKSGYQFIAHYRYWHLTF